MKQTKIAIIDDELEFVNDLAKGLDVLGYEVYKAGSGAHAIEVINKNKPDIVLCDYKLDDMDGTLVIQKTKSANPQIVYIMVTAYYDEGLVDTFKKEGAAEVVYKPIQLDKLDAVIQKHIKN